MINLIIIVYQILLLLVTIKSVLLLKSHYYREKIFPLTFYLVITCSIEYYSWIRKVFFEDYINGLIYNIYFIISLFIFHLHFKLCFKSSVKKLSNIFLLTSFILITNLTQFLNREFDLKIGLIVSFFYILISLLWFFQKINSSDENKITADSYFWVSTGLLLWSIFFIFRIIPMYLFNATDKNFLKLLKTLLNLVNIITYSLFYVGLLKFEKIKPNEPTP